MPASQPRTPDTPLLQRKSKNKHQKSKPKICLSLPKCFFPLSFVHAGLVQTLVFSLALILIGGYGDVGFWGHPGRAARPRAPACAQGDPWPVLLPSANFHRFAFFPLANGVLPCPSQREVIRDKTVTIFGADAPLPFQARGGSTWAFSCCCSRLSSTSAPASRSPAAPAEEGTQLPAKAVCPPRTLWRLGHCI